MATGGQLKEYKLGVLGNGGIGKTALTIQFVHGLFVDEYNPTIQDDYRKRCDIDGEDVILEISDISGQEEYDLIREQCMRTGEGFLLVYSITSRTSFEEISIFHQQILRAKDQASFPVIVVAAKCDLEYERQVGTNEGRELASKIGCKYIETSAKQSLNVNEVFTDLVLEIRRHDKAKTLPGTRPTWTPEQTQAVHNVRALFVNSKLPLGTARTPSQRATLPRPRRGFPPEGVNISSVLVPPARDIHPVLLDGRILPDQVPCFFYSTSPIDDLVPSDTKVVLYQHGGGNMLGHPTDAQFLPALSNLVKKLDGGIVFATSYRCATIPENTFPANLQDVFAAYQYLLDQGYKPDNITIAGDSSGGNLSIAVTYILSQTNIPLPSRLVAFAPATDLTYNLSTRAAAQADVDVYPIRVYKESTAHYLNDPQHSTFSQEGPTGNSKWKPTNPLVSTAFIPSFPVNWPKTLIFVGTADQLMDGSSTLAENMKASGVDVELVVYENLIHAFWVFPFFPEAELAYDRFADFVKT